ncbi:MAG: hypothetical protein V3T17_11375 [Pseudomonadales bacterium]
MNKNKPLRVRARDLSPRQRHTRAGFKRSIDCYERCMLKHPARSVFHSRAELYHAALLESDPTVTSYVPQPFSLSISGKMYIPDCYVVQSGKRRVIELKPRGEFDDALHEPLAAYFSLQGMVFEVVPNEWALNRSMEAENWLQIISVLHTGQALDTDVDESQILIQFQRQPTLALGEILDPGDRLGSLSNEVALFRLLHRGVITSNLSDAPLDYSTEFKLCT